MSNSSSPFEKLFDLDPGSSAPIIELEQTGLINPASGEVIERSATPSEDQIELEERLSDLEIDRNLSMIHNRAMQAFEQQHTLAQDVDPKFSARNSEVAAQFLNIALNSINSKTDSKFKRQKIRIAKGNVGTPNTVNNNLIVADRNQLLKNIFKDNETQ